MKVYLLMLFVFVNTANTYSIGDDSYERISALQDSILASGDQSNSIRPIKNQSQILRVSVSFSIVAVVSVDDVMQKMITNGFLVLWWKDQRHSWNPDDYGGVKRLAPGLDQIWLPRLLLINTLHDERDPFPDEHSGLLAFNDGMVVWLPGGLFHTYCALNLQKYPFDVQLCYIQLCPMSHPNTSIQFVPTNVMNMGFYIPNPGWDIIDTKVTVEDMPFVPGRNFAFSCPTFYFRLKRRPTTIILNVICPIIFMSALNNQVFLIPMESGEKISYAITVLLSLSVFLSMVSTMTPQVSDVVPALTIYLFVLLLSSVLTVGAAIFTVYLHHQKERMEDGIKSQESLAILRTLATGSSTNHETNNNIIGMASKNIPSDEDFYVKREHEQVCHKINNKYNTILKYVNKLFFIVMTAVWILTNVWFFAFTST